MTKPNFSGSWKFNPDKSVPAISPPDSALFVIDHYEPRLRISRTHVIGGNRDTFTLGAFHLET